MENHNEYQPLMLSTQQLLGAYWPQIEPLLATCPVAEEFPPETIYEAALAGQMRIFVFKKETPSGPDVGMLMVISAVPSESFPIVNIIAVAGSGLKKLIGSFWEHFKGWCVMNGARAIDAYVPEGMEEFMKELGLTRESIHVRLRL